MNRLGNIKTTMFWQWIFDLCGTHKDRHWVGWYLEQTDRIMGTTTYKGVVY